jgi:hypothetical protein
MKPIAWGAAAALIVVSWSGAAAEQAPDRDKAVMEEKCKTMGEQHGMKGDKMDAWMKKCLEIVGKMRQDAKGGGDMGAQDMHSRTGGDNGMGGYH